MTTPAVESTPAAGPAPVAPEEVTAAGTGGEATTTVSGTVPVEVMRQVESHMSGSLIKASHMDHRSMENNLKCHELVRMFMTVVSTFNVDGDPEWVVRSCRDYANMMVRRLHEAYGPLFGAEYINEFGTELSGRSSTTFCSARVYMMIQVSLLKMTVMMMLMMMTMMMMTTTMMMVMVIMMMIMMAVIKM